MSRPLAVGAGLIVGVLVTATVLGAIVVLGPAPGLAPLPTPSASPEPSASGDVPSLPPDGSAEPSPDGSATPAPTIIASGFHIGEPAPALKLPQVGGGEVDLSSLAGKAVWVNFMATWCPPCQDEFPIMNGFAARYADDGLVVVAVDVREDEGTVAAFAQSLGVIFPMALDAEGAARDTWEAFALPMHFWIDQEGVVRDGAFGGIGPDYMAEALRKILPGVEIET